MNEYLFQAGAELARVRVDSERKLYLQSKITGNEFVELTEKLFHDREKRSKFRLMMQKIPKLTQDELDIYLVAEFGKMGYKLIKKM